MLDWFKRNKYSAYRKWILDAFPQALKKDVERVLDILPFGETDKEYDLINSGFLIVQIEGEQLAIPGRLYFNEPVLSKELALTGRQKTILNCIFLRHHNGYVRQKRLEAISTAEYWVTPFTFQLLGEYVFELLQVLDRQFEGSTLENHKRFVLENPKYLQRTERRVRSYWNEYFKTYFPTFELYLGKLLLDSISSSTNDNIQTNNGNAI